MRRRARIGVAGLLATLTAGLGAGSAGASGTASKAGVASGHYLARDPATLSRRLGASWAYDWSARAPRDGGGPEWVPMVWGRGSVTGPVLRALRSEAQRGRARYLLGFNEPDSGGQSNFSPAAAAALWPRLEQTGLRLGSPAPAVPTDGWLARFMALAGSRHLRVDFIALHYYQDFTNPHAVDDLRGQLMALHREFGKPIWITEIGALDISAWGEPMAHRPSVTAALAYMRRLFAMLDALPFVQRYAWFTDDCWNDTGCRYGSLFDGRGRITAAGREFRALQAQAARRPR